MARLFLLGTLQLNRISNLAYAIAIGIANVCAVFGCC